MKKELQNLIERSKSLNLREEDVNDAQEFLENREYELCFDTIATQMFEYEINIDINTLLLMEDIIQQMGLSKERYSYIKNSFTNNTSI